MFRPWAPGARNFLPIWALGRPRMTVWAPLLLWTAISCAVPSPPKLQPQPQPNPPSSLQPMLGSGDSGARERGASGIDVSMWGTMREVLRQGQSQGRVALTSILKPTTIGVGALAGLEGEITIVDGQAYVAIGSALKEATVPIDLTRPGRATRANSGRTGPADHGGPADLMEPSHPGLRWASTADSAALLITAEVSDWDEVPLGDCPDYSTLEARIAAQLRKRGRELTEPQPVRVRGAARGLRLHVIAGACPIANPEGPAPWHYDGPAADVELIGFYVEGAAGRLTHHDRSSHLHVLAGDLTGHLEDVRIEDVTLLLPRIR